MTVYNAKDVTTALAKRPESWPKLVTLEIEAGDYAWNPSSLLQDFAGPATVWYFQYSDGGILSQIKEK